jgi:hypothetical protein
VAFLGSAWLVRRIQARVAMQSRLDICAVRIVAGRKRLLEEIVWTNRVLEGTKVSIYAARGAKAVAGPVGAVFGTMTEAALLVLNRATAIGQEARLLAAEAVELSARLCAATPYSRGTAFCAVRPGVRGSLQRESTIFPDVRGPLRHRGRGPLLRADCRGDALRTQLVLEGDPDLERTDFMDRYEK